jgi:hypothetical protein
VRIWDPEINRADPTKTLSNAAQGADVVVLANDHPAPRADPAWRWTERMSPGGCVLDVCPDLEANAAVLPNGIRLRRLGDGHAGPSPARHDSSRVDAEAAMDRPQGATHLPRLPARSCSSVLGRQVNEPGT